MFNVLFQNITDNMVICRNHWPNNSPMKKVNKGFRPACPPSLFQGSQSNTDDLFSKVKPEISVKDVISQDFQLFVDECRSKDSVVQHKPFFC